MPWVVLALGVSFNTAAHVLLKLAMVSEAEQPGHTGFLARMMKPTWIVGIVCFGLSVMLYSYVLSKLELSVAQPVMTCAALLLVLLISLFFFNESYHWTKMVGIALLISGIVLMCRSV